jgi:hypothetical protein
MSNSGSGAAAREWLAAREAELFRYHISMTHSDAPARTAYLRLRALLG